MIKRNVGTYLYSLYPFLDIVNIRKQYLELQQPPCDHENLREADPETNFVGPRKKTLELPFSRNLFRHGSGKLPPASRDPLVRYPVT